MSTLDWTISCHRAATLDFRTLNGAAEIHYRGQSLVGPVAEVKVLAD
ncbi:MAG: hypothetical protein VYA34_05505 [Myxococcota bacterium]|nr:hypothetical protein [Myxococcota bacterium]